MSVRSLDHAVVDVLHELDAAACFDAIGLEPTPRGRHALGSISHLARTVDACRELVGVPVDGPQRAARGRRATRRPAAQLRSAKPPTGPPADVPLPVKPPSGLAPPCPG